jgi:23S rRNA pseudouridine1911/1915/1917 synthase
MADAVGSRAAAERVIDAGVLVDGVRRAKSWKLQGGEDVQFEPPVGPAPLQHEDVPLRIAHEDDHLLVIDKPAGVMVHPGAGQESGTVVHGLLGTASGGDAGRPGIVHRLDRDTSGLMVVAKTHEAYEGLSGLVRTRALEREYLALVKGRPRSRRGTIDAPIGRDRRDPVRRSLDTETPREAVTQFEVVELMREHALLRVRLETGRTHQIRVHLAAIDLPVSGDPVYGAPGDLGLARQFLHAARLAFDHPVAGNRIEVESPLPSDLEAALQTARD